ncbi:MAG: hypothetical protein HKN33_04605, partial [Pyrinomonadaceae bacterium]|nr:hypothetical protein [Pyrinomonadaceae bacterium]
MKTKNSQEERRDQPAETRDPFAVDIFERHSEKEGEEGFALESVRAVPLPERVSRDWSAGLETVSYGEASESETPRYPDWIDEKVANYGLPSLSKLFPGAGPGKFEIVAFEDMDAKEALSGGSFRKSLFLVLELNGNAGVIEISTDLAKQVVARLLGQGNGEFESTRSLSTIEQAICEYVAATVLSGLNKGISGTIRLVGAETAIDINQLPDRILRLDCEITLGGETGQLKLFLGPETLSKLNARYEKSSSDDVSRVERFAGFIEDRILNLTIGKTKVPAIEIPFFETDDIVLIESPVASWWQGSYECGPILCRVNGSNVSIKGRFVAEAEEGHPRFRVSAGGADLNAKRFTRLSPPASF